MQRIAKKNTYLYEQDFTWRGGNSCIGRSSSLGRLASWLVHLARSGSMSNQLGVCIYPLQYYVRILCISLYLFFSKYSAQSTIKKSRLDNPQKRFPAIIPIIKDDVFTRKFYHQNRVRGNKKVRRKYLTGFMFAFLLIITTACSGGEETGNDTAKAEVEKEKITLKFAVSQPATHIIVTETLEPFMERVNELTDGQVDFEFLSRGTNR